jgi:hypothetical protein
MALHLIKLCVGIDAVEELEAYWRGETKRVMHTRQTPKRAEELLDGGSLYWVIKGVIQCRQTIAAVETVGEGQQARCEVLLNLPVVRTAPAPRRPFQGWRYLKPEEAPPDLAELSAGADMPSDLAAKLRELGAW